MDNRAGVAIVLHNLGLVALDQDELRQAASLFWKSMALAQEVNIKTATLWNVWALARVAVAEGSARRTVQLFAAAEPALKPEYGLGPFDLEDTDREVALARAQLGEEAFAAAWAEGKAMTLEEAVVLALEEY